jgi:hypothetical protein
LVFWLLAWAQFFPSLKGTPWLADPDLAMAILVATDVWHWTPYMTFMCLGGLASIPRENRGGCEELMALLDSESFGNCASANEGRPSCYGYPENDFCSQDV